MPEHLSIKPYNRNLAVAYAQKWAYGRNPEYYDFSNLGGDCTNFASQCIYAGSKVMNFTHPLGWYYISANRRSASWTGVEYLYNFLTRTSSGVGPFGHEVEIEDVMPGDIIQLLIDQPRFHHSPVVVSVGEPPTAQNILLAAHSFNSDDRPLSSYQYKKIRFIHIDGVRYM